MSLRHSFWRSSDFVLGPCVRAISATPTTTYLTFDDGPDTVGTMPLLDLLDKLQVPATFFLVANRARVQKNIVNTLLQRGHSIGNHSLDHSYRYFFQGRKRLQSWIAESENILTCLTGTRTVGFRPPAGVRTPELKGALLDLNIPLILWEQRYFDTVMQLSSRRMIKAYRQQRGGSITLLHDRKSEASLTNFLAALTQYIEFARVQGTTFGRLTFESTLQELSHAQTNF